MPLCKQYLTAHIASKQMSLTLPVPSASGISPVFLGFKKYSLTLIERKQNGELI
jgi:hypothetical protein